MDAKPTNKILAQVKNMKNSSEQLFPQKRLSGNLVGISINLCKSIQKKLFINDAP